MSNFHSDDLYTCLPPQNAYLMYNDSVSNVYSPTALPSGSVLAAQNVSDELTDDSFW